MANQHAASQSSIIVALDFPDPAQALGMLERLDPRQCRVKIGKEAFTHTGPALVETAIAAGFDVFLDLKFHDIPNTVAGACAAAADLGVWMLNLHASGGKAMMRTARERLDQLERPPLLIAVTVLTSMDAEDLSEIGCPGSPEARVLQLAHLARDAGLDGVVCSAREAAMLRRELGPDFLLVTPGVRPANAQTADQKRIMTPAAARAAGSDYLVIGRPITGADDPAAALAAIQAELKP